MLLLAVDTSGKNGSLSLVRFDDPDHTSPKNREIWSTDGFSRSTQPFDVLELVTLEGRMYSAQLIPELQNALARQNLRKTDIDGYVVASGPGSFTGLRVGLSTVKALSEVLHKPIAAVSVLEAAARMTGVNGHLMVAIDAGRKQVFVGEYEFGEEFKMIRRNEYLITFEQFLDPTSPKRGEIKLFSPDQAVRETAAAQGITIGDMRSPQADTFARIGYQKIIAGETTPAEILEANYIRASDAELFSLPKLMP